MDRPESVLDEDWDVIVVDAPSGTDSSPPLAALYTLARWFGLPGLVSGFVSPGMRHSHSAFDGLDGLGPCRHGANAAVVWDGRADGSDLVVASAGPIPRRRQSGTHNQPNTDLSTRHFRRLLIRRAIVAAGGYRGARCGAAGGAGVRGGLPRDAAHGGDSPSPKPDGSVRFGRKGCRG